MTREQYFKRLASVKTVEVNQEAFKKWFLEQESERLDTSRKDDKVFMCLEEAEDHFSYAQGTFAYENQTHFSRMSLAEDTEGTQDEA